MTPKQTIIAVLIGLGSWTLAVGLVVALWTAGLRLLDRYARRHASFEVIVALGHLRGKKSGYLKAMTVFVLGAITLANFSLPTVLSVMGGFGDDLKQKILQATAHVLIDEARPELNLPATPTPEDYQKLANQLTLFSNARVVLFSKERSAAQALASELRSRGIEDDRIEIRIRRNAPHKGVRILNEGRERSIDDAEELSKTIRGQDQVSGVTPFIDADVMLASQTNIAAVVLKGVDPDTMGSVINLESTVEQGKIGYLNNPETIMQDVVAERQRRLKRLLDEEDRARARDSGDGGSTKRDGGPDGGSLLAPKMGSLFSSSRRTSKNKASDYEVLPAVIVGRELAKTLRVFVGDEVNVVSPLGGMGPMGPIPKARPYRVAGVFYSGMYQDDAKNAYVRLDVAQQFLGMDERVSGLRIRVENIEDASWVASNIREGLGPRYRVRPWEEVNASLFGALRLEKIAMFVLYSVFFIISAFLIASTLTMMVLEKRRGIAVLKTLGASNRRLGVIFMTQGMIAGIVGTISGQTAAFLQCLALGTFVEIQPEVYYISHLPVAMDPVEFAWVAVLSLVTAAVATLLPLAATVVLRPVDGLRL